MKMAQCYLLIQLRLLLLSIDMLLHSNSILQLMKQRRCGVMYEDNTMLRKRVDGRDRGKRGVAKETVQYLCSSGEGGEG